MKYKKLQNIIRFRILLKLFFVLLIGFSLNFSVYSQTPASVYGQLKVSGSKILDQNNNPVQLRGMSFFWSQWIGKYYNSSCVKWLADDWKCTVVRAAMAVDQEGYATDPVTEKNKIMAVVDAAIANGIYVIIDFHVHDATPYLSQAKTFFSEMAQKYGNSPNVIYEIWNEPLQVSWTGVIKPYAESVIQTIRQYDPDNIIIVGTPTWSQDVDVAAQSPITTSTNIAYTLHYYAGTHKQWLRDKAVTAMNKGIAIFITEYGIVNSDGDGAIDQAESNAWYTFCDNNKISHCNWSVADKDESSAVLVANASTTGGWSTSQLKASGVFVRNELRTKYNLDPGTIAVTGVSMSPASVSLTIGSTSSLTATVIPSNATDKSVSWTSSNTSIATVNSAGVVTGNSSGSATITVTTVDGSKTASSTIIVNDGNNNTLCSNPTAISLPLTHNGVGEFCWSTSGTITYVNSWNMDFVKINGVDFTNKYSNSMPAIIDGKYYIHCKGSLSYSHIEIIGTGGGSNIAVTGVSITPTTLTINTAATSTLSATVLPSNATNKSVSWSSSNTSVATVNSTGIVTGGVVGTATITVTTTDGAKTATSLITVNPSSISVTGVTVSPATLTMSVGSNTVLTATVSPSNASNKNVTWSSSNSVVAMVNSAGIVTGVAAGTASIIVSTVDGAKTATSVIAVTCCAVVPVTGVTVTPTTASVNVGSTTTLTATVAPSNASNKAVNWSSANTAIASVSSSGVITGVGTGSVTITATTVDGARTATSLVTVNNTTTTICTNPVAITIPFTQNGIGEYCWSTAQAMAYVNSWNMDLVEINGADFTNKWGNNIPVAIDGKWYIHYKASVSWAHFEAPALKDAPGIEMNQNSDVRVYPNPFSNEINIDFSGLEGVNRIELYNSIGQLVSLLAENQLTSGMVNIQLGGESSMLILRIYAKDKVIVKSLIRK